ncbi:MAG: precorrin-2 C(20)-methyltransferase [Nodosilinea sp.]
MSDSIQSPSAASPLGTLTGIGVGPGDPDLITVRALHYLRQAAVVAFPRGRDGAPGVAQKIIAPHLGAQQLLSLDFPYVLDPAQLTLAWQRAADQVWAVLRQGQDVVFACEGDISFYGTFTYLAQALQATHPEVTIRRVPGVSSPMAAASALGLPLTVQGDKLAVLPALYSLAELGHTLDWADVVVLLKVSSVYGQVWPLLHQRQLLSQSWVVVRASQPDQQIYRDLARYPELDLPYFSLMVIRCGANPLG